LVFPQPGNQLAMTLCGVRERLPQCESANAGIHLVFGHVNTDDNEIVLCHLPLPSLLGSGSKPLQLFGLRKTTGAVPCSDLRLCRLWGVTGSVPATGGFARTARSHILADFADKGALAIVTNVGRDAVDAAAQAARNGRRAGFRL
jgi:hypothetical protein